MGSLHIQIIEPGSILPAGEGLAVDLTLYAVSGHAEALSGITGADGSLILLYDDSHAPFERAVATISERSYSLNIDSSGALTTSHILRLDDDKPSKDPCCFELETGAVMSRACYTQLIRIDQPEVKKFTILEHSDLTLDDAAALKELVNSNDDSASSATTNDVALETSASYFSASNLRMYSDFVVDTSTQQEELKTPYSVPNPAYNPVETETFTNPSQMSSSYISVESPLLSAEDIEATINSPTSLFSPTLNMTAASLADGIVLSAYSDIVNELAMLNPLPARFEMNCDARLPWDYEPEIVQPCRPYFLHALKFCQEIIHVGEFAGRVVGTETFMPNQKRQISTITYKREDTNTQQETFVVADSLSASQSRQRDIQDLQSATLQQASQGSSRSSTASVSASASFPMLGGVIGVSGGYSTSSSSASQSSSRQMASAASQNLSDATQQASQSLRSQTVTVMQATSQTETTSATTEVIKNYNMSRTMDLVSREVLAAYDVCHRLDHVSVAIAVPLDVSMFSEAKALRWRDALQGRLRERGLDAAFDALERRLSDYSGVALPQGQFANSEIITISGHLNLEVRISPPQPDTMPDFAGTNLPWWLAYNINYRTRWMAAWEKVQNKKEAWFLENVAPNLAREVVQNIRVIAVDNNGNETDLDMDASALTIWNGQGQIKVGFNATTGLPVISRADIAYIKFSLTDGVNPIEDIEDLLPAGSEFIVRSGQFDYETNFQSEKLFGNARINDDLGPTGDDVLVRTALSRREKLNPVLEDLQLRNKLLQELNTNLLHYHEICYHYLAVFQPSRLRMLLDRVFVPNSTTQSVRSIIGDYLGAFDGCVCFEVAPGYDFTQDLVGNDDPNAEPINWLEYYGDGLDPKCDRIVLPTGSVFTKATLGCCVVAEEIDRSLNVQWLERYDEDGPSIGEASLGSRFESPNTITPTQLATSLISLQETMDAPDYTGTSDIITAMSKSDLFSDITGLSGTQGNVKAAFSEALSSAGSARQDALKIAQADQIKETTRAKNFDTVRAKLEKDLKDKVITPEYYKDAVQKLYNSTLKQQDKPTPTEIKKELDESKPANDDNSNFVYSSPDEFVAYTAQMTNAIQPTGYGLSAANEADYMKTLLLSGDDLGLIASTDDYQDGETVAGPEQAEQSADIIDRILGSTTSTMQYYIKSDDNLAALDYLAGLLTGANAPSWITRRLSRPGSKLRLKFSAATTAQEQAIQARLPEDGVVTINGQPGVLISSGNEPSKPAAHGRLVISYASQIARRSDRTFILRLAKYLRRTDPTQSALFSTLPQPWGNRLD